MDKISLIVLGPQGSGKGTQANLLAEHYGLPKFSMGDALREVVASQSPLGRKLAPIVARGDLISAEDGTQVVDEFLSKLDLEKGLVAEGIPRFMDQVAPFIEALRRRGLPEPWVVALKIQDATAIERVSKRMVCSGCQHPAKPGDTSCVRCGSKLIRRSDEDDTTLRNRLRNYHEQTEPVIAQFRSRGRLIEVDGQAPVEKVYDEIVRQIENRRG